MQTFLADLTQPFEKIAQIISTTIAKNNDTEIGSESTSKKNISSAQADSVETLIFNYMKSNMSLKIDRFLIEKSFNVKLK